MACRVVIGTPETDRLRFISGRILLTKKNDHFFSSLSSRPSDLYIFFFHSSRLTGPGANGQTGLTAIWVLRIRASPPQLQALVNVAKDNVTTLLLPMEVLLVPDPQSR